MALPEFSMRSLLEAGAHFGHQTHRWNPKMERYIFGSRSNIHIIDLSQSIPLLHQALVAVRDVAAKGGRVLFVGTKRQASDPVAEAAKRCAQYYVNHRWLGGIRDMGSIPDIMFVIDTNKEAIAILEARKLNIPVIAILDTNCDPDGITYPIPGNDDAARAIQTYCDLIADAVLDGLAAGQSASGVDLGAAINPEEPMLREARAPKAKVEDVAPAGTEAVAEEMIAAAEPVAEAPTVEAAAEEPAVADKAAQTATSDANDAVETEEAAV